jgi:hypothetical protein
VRSVGGKGSGPGEFGRLAGLALRGDTVYGFDAERRVSQFTLSGVHVRTVRLVADIPGHSLVSPAGVLADGSLVVSTGRNTLRARAAGIQIDSAGLALVSADGRSGTLLGLLPFAEVADHTDTRNVPVPFGARLAVAVNLDRICTGRPRSYEIRCFGSDGTLRAITRIAAPAVALTGEDRAAWADGYRRANVIARERAGFPPPDPDRWIRDTRFPETLPSFSRLLAGTTENLWVREYRREDGLQRPAEAAGAPASDSALVRWSVFGPNGVWRAVVDLPAGFRLFQADAEALTGVGRNADDVEWVTVVRLRSR